MSKLKAWVLRKLPNSITGYIKPTLIVVALILIAVYVPNFYTPTNLIGLLSQGAAIGIASLGMTLVIISGGIDISMGSNIYVSGVIATEIYRHSNNLPLAIVGGIAAGTLCGIINGFGVAILDIPPLITTLSTSLAFQGAGSLLIGSGSALAVGGIYKYISVSRFLGLQSCAWIFLVLFAIYVLLFNFSPFIKHVYALGDNPDAFKATRISSKKIYMLVYIIAGLMCGIAGVVTTARLGGTQFNMSLGTETYCIAAVVVGGASMTGGKGTIYGTFFGVLIVAALDNILRLMNINAYVYDVIWGVLLFLVVCIDIIQVHQKKRAEEKATGIKLVKNS